MKYVWAKNNIYPLGKKKKASTLHSLNPRRPSPRPQPTFAIFGMASDPHSTPLLRIPAFHGTKIPQGYIQRNLHPCNGRKISSVAAMTSLYM
jgi:hypothetical protein